MERQGDPTTLLTKVISPQSSQSSVNLYFLEINDFALVIASVTNEDILNVHIEPLEQSNPTVKDIWWQNRNISEKKRKRKKRNRAIIDKSSNTR
jgi:hypothetical protein